MKHKATTNRRVHRKGCSVTEDEINAELRKIRQIDALKLSIFVVWLIATISILSI